MKLYCHPSDLQKIEDNKTAFINNMVALNIKYDVCALLSQKMNEAIKEIKKANK